MLGSSGWLTPKVSSQGTIQKAYEIDILQLVEIIHESQHFVHLMVCVVELPPLWAALGGIKTLVILVIRVS